MLTVITSFHFTVNGPLNSFHQTVSTVMVMATQALCVIEKCSTSFKHSLCVVSLTSTTKRLQQKTRARLVYAIYMEQKRLSQIRNTIFHETLFAIFRHHAAGPLQINSAYNNCDQVEQFYHRCCRWINL